MSDLLHLLHVRATVAGLTAPPSADKLRQFRTQLRRFVDRNPVTPLSRDTVVDAARRRTMHAIEVAMPLWAHWDTLTMVTTNSEGLTQLIVEKYGGSIEGLVASRAKAVVQLLDATMGMDLSTRRSASFAQLRLPMPVCSSQCDCNALRSGRN